MYFDVELKLVEISKYMLIWIYSILKHSGITDTGSILNNTNKSTQISSTMFLFF